MVECEESCGTGASNTEQATRVLAFYINPHCRVLPESVCLIVDSWYHQIHQPLALGRSAGIPGWFNFDNMPGI